MGDSHASSDEKPTLQDVLDALDDPDCRSILRETIEPMTATELTNACDIPKSTLYRKLDLLSTASLVREQETVSPDGGRVTRYECTVEDVTVSIDDEGEFSVRIDRPSRETDERLADLWSMMGEEL
ncbi:MAG: putative transcriptional regulator [Natronomonas sp.]|jgi:predicted transcriptional regulator